MSDEELKSLSPDIPYWGKVEPISEHAFCDIDGINLFYVGAFQSPRSEVVRFKPIYFNGAEWVQKIPPSFTDSIPLYGCDKAYGDGTSKFTERTIVIVSNPMIADAFNSYMEELQEEEYVAMSFYGSFREVRAANVEYLIDKNVYLWPDTSSYCLEVMSALQTTISSAAGNLFRIGAPEGCGSSWSVMDVIKKKDWTQLMLLFKNKEELELETPERDCDSNGITHLEHEVPYGFVLSVKNKIGKDGKILPNFYSIQYIADNDPAIESCIKFDMGTGSPIWHKRYSTIDELKNAILRRYSQYGLYLSKGAREDIVAALQSKSSNRIDTIRDFFEALIQKHQGDNESAIEVLMDHVELEDGFDRAMAVKTFKMFFTNACLLIQSSKYGLDTPNDICPVIWGDQGCGKSRFVRYLAMESRFFVDIGSKANITLGSPDCSRIINGRFIAELGEMGIYKKSDVETVKAWISETVDEFIPKFAEGVRKFPRTASAIGTSNHKRMLRDLSGNRRFYPIGVKSINHKGLFSNKELIERVWAHFYGVVKAVMDEEDEDYRRLLVDALKSKDPSVEKYFDAIRDGSIDTGALGTVIQDCITRLEVESYKTWSQGPRDEDKIMIGDIEIIKDIYGSGSRLPPDFLKTVRSIARRMGYNAVDGYIWVSPYNEILSKRLERSSNDIKIFEQPEIGATQVEKKVVERSPESKKRRKWD